MNYHVIQGELKILNTNVKLATDGGVAEPALKENPNQAQSDSTVDIA